MTHIEKVSDKITVIHMGCETPWTVEVQDQKLVIQERHTDGHFGETLVFQFDCEHPVDALGNALAEIQATYQISEEDRKARIEHMKDLDTQLCEAMGEYASIYGIPEMPDTDVLSFMPKELQDVLGSLFGGKVG